MECRAQFESAPYHWTEQDDYRAFLKLLERGKFKVNPIISGVYSPEQANYVYQTLAEKKIRRSDSFSTGQNFDAIIPEYSAVHCFFSERTDSPPENKKACIRIN